VVALPAAGLGSGGGYEQDRRGVRGRHGQQGELFFRYFWHFVMNFGAVEVLELNAVLTVWCLVYR
jgi:hypothetical protein